LVKMSKELRKKRLDVEVIIRPWVTEKTAGLIERENTLVFEVNPAFNKPSIKRAVEQRFEVKVDSVRTLNTPDNRKKAFVKLTPEYRAQELATRLGVL